MGRVVTRFRNKIPTERKGRMSDNKSYYYIKIKDNFFESDEMILLESMQDGYLYSNILLKLYLRSLKNDGKLMVNEVIPYNAQMLANIVRHQVGTVERAMKVFEQLNLVEILDNGAIYMMNIQNLIGKSSTEADRKREYRQKIDTEKKKLEKGLDSEMGQMSRQVSDKYPPELELEIELEKDNIVSKDTIRSTDVQRTIETWNHLGISQVTKLNPNTKRYKMLKARIKEYGIEKVIEAIEGIDHSSFLKGQNNRAWVITFDWFVMPNNFIKVLDGNYLDRGTATPTKEESQTEDYWQ